MKKLIFLVLVGCSQTNIPPDAGTPAAAQPDVPKHPGERTYIMYCAGGHGYDGKGNNGLGADFVNDKTRLAKADGELFQSIWHGKGRMPAWRGVITKEQVQQVILYIRTTFGHKKEK